MPPRQVDKMWSRFTDVTRARIGLGRSGDALPTQHSLDFQYAHACARDAVAARVDFAALAAQLQPTPTHQVHSAAGDRSTYLRRPDLGRMLAGESAAGLPSGPYDAVFVIADGLSAGAVRTHAVPTVRAATARLAGWALGPVILAEQARVALGDEIGALMGAAMVVVLIGERPGLTVPNSLGIYLTYGPRVGRRDAERNCISNIHADGLPYAAAAEKLEWLMSQARVLRLTGVELKEDSPGIATPGDVAPGVAALARTAQKSLDSEPT
jgi:ethanolamine ammonia-lyase small subunit